MWGTDSVKAICKQAKRLGYHRLALTDTDNLYGLWPFIHACRDQGITPIIGAEITDRETKARAVCLVKNNIGYTNLTRLITRRHTDKTFRLETAVPNFSDGLAVLSTHTDLLVKWHKTGIHVFAAMPRHPLSPFHRLCRTAKEHGIPLVATPGSFFLRPEGIEIHRLLRAIAGNTSLSRLDPMDTAPADAWLAGPRQYRQRFALFPEAIENTFHLADQLAFSSPDFGLVMPPWQDAHGQSADHCLRNAAYEGAKHRYGHDLSENVVSRMEHELKVIKKRKFSAYFLVVKEIVAKSPRTCGRGSGAASLVAYCLGITNVCPVKHNLYFERFLNPGRKDPPDIDVDFAWDERDGVIDTVLARFKGRAAMVSSHVLFQPRMAVRETAKVFGLTHTEIGKVSKKIPWFMRSGELDDGLMDALKNRPETRHMDFLHPWPDILRLAKKIIGTPRCLSVHPGGVVITPHPIDGYVPVEISAKGVPIIQWEKDSTEEAGLVKIDLLGNRSLGVIRDAIKNIHGNQISFDETRWEPEDDIPTQNALARGRTMGCFYIESPAMRLLQQKAEMGDFEHLVIHSSIIRPAANEFIQAYIKRLKGGPWDPIHPLLADVLDETYGIMVYQEDVSKAAVSMAGFSHADADGLRKVMSKKDKKRRLMDYHDQFVKGARQNNVSDRQIDAVWKMMMSFSGYSFCKPHSASYARVSFQAAWLKVHFPAEFMAGVISNQGGFYSTFAYVSEARRMGLTLKQPDVNRSHIRWHGKKNLLYVGLMAVAGLSLATMNKIISCRDKKKFTSMTDFLLRARPDDAEARALIFCGALDRFSPDSNRAQLLWTLAGLKAEKKRSTEGKTLFSETETSFVPAPKLPPEDPKERLRREFSVMGFLCDRHPITLYESVVKKRSTVNACEIPRFSGKRISLAAWLITGKVVHTRHHEPMEFLTFEDDTGIVETTFFPGAYKRFCHMLDRGRPYLISGTVDENWGTATLTVDRVEAL